MLGFFVVPIGTGGELRCTACTTADAVEQRPLAEIEADLDAIALQGDDLNVIFVGMEPFRHAELPQIIGSARARGFDRIKLRTDAGA